ncbi:TniB family NTP-binding protein [Planctobacterium marinum]|uniref:TniB family NTP-binding protein n=1 Tax=Planctobacterium marinum TaxID=1631968 RepID=UPI001E5BAE80|nr:TniB family NTP-binding protein [Planctobacterium marinum]MCC2606571.1 TniB family NTP-binding protein [Planctobacterium marinum]
MDDMVKNAHEHLNEVAREALALSNTERKKYIRSARWIGYTRAKTVLNKMEDLLAYPKKHRMPNLLIVGDSNSGKTMIAERFISLNPSYEKETNDGIVIPALFVQSPPVPNESRLYSHILDKLFAPYRPSDSPDKKLFQVKKLMEACDVRMLIIDEFHSMLAGPLDKQRIYLSAIRSLGNALRIPIVALGTKDALRAIKTDPQLDNRFKASFLPRWEQNIEFKRLLLSFERMLPLRKASDLKSQTLSKQLYAMSEGLLGELAEILSEAAIDALNDGSECITLQGLKNLDWEPPSKRRRENG